MSDASTHSISSDFPAPYATLLWTAHVSVGAREELGQNKNGTRYLVPITGGTFTGGAGFESLSGTVMTGGADRQLIRPDGVKELEAIYDMQLTDGPIMSIHNKVIVDEARQPQRYALSVLGVMVPSGAFEWLNRRLIIGTLESLRPAKDIVIIRAWLMDSETN